MIFAENIVESNRGGGIQKGTSGPRVRNYVRQREERASLCGEQNGHTGVSGFGVNDGLRREIKKGGSKRDTSKADAIVRRICVKGVG